MDGGFQVSVSTQDGRATVAPRGELDIAGAQEFEQAIRSARAEAGALTVDLSELEFIDSSGLRVLVGLHNASITDGFAYTVIAGGPQVHRIFVLSGLDRTLSFAT